MRNIFILCTILLSTSLIAQRDDFFAAHIRYMHSRHQPFMWERPHPRPAMPPIQTKEAVIYFYENILQKDAEKLSKYKKELTNLDANSKKTKRLNSKIGKLEKKIGKFGKFKSKLDNELTDLKQKEIMKYKDSLKEKTEEISRYKQDLATLDVNSRKFKNLNTRIEKLEKIAYTLEKTLKDLKLKYTPEQIEKTVLTADSHN